jgi:Arc/MetJ-type ribon-helix-helix transcriptional regulator
MARSAGTSDALPIDLLFMYYEYMARSINVLRKRRGRPATGQVPVMAVRLPPKLKSKVGAWANHQGDKPSLSEAIRRLLEKALAGTSTPRQPSKGAARKATEMAAREIDPVLVDQPATGEKRASRKRRLLSGPKEFRDIRRK